MSQKVAAQLSVNIAVKFSVALWCWYYWLCGLFPEKEIYDLFAYVSITKDRQVIASKKQTATGEAALQVQLFYTAGALKLLRKTITQDH